MGEKTAESFQAETAFPEVFFTIRFLILLNEGPLMPRKDAM